jgi:hypothetical protein
LKRLKPENTDSIKKITAQTNSGRIAIWDEDFFRLWVVVPEERRVERAGCFFRLPPLLREFPEPVETERGFFVPVFDFDLFV